MKLFFSATSPYVRKVMLTAMHHGLDARIELIPVNALENPPGLMAVNPLSKVPALVTDDGLTLANSSIIAEYLDGLGAAPKLFPASPAARLKAQRLHGYADLVMDALVTRRLESLRPADPARMAVIARQSACAAGGLDLLEADAAGLDGLSSIGEISLACLCGYLDFRFAEDAWRTGRPNLAAWWDGLSGHPALTATAPKV